MDVVMASILLQEGGGELLQEDPTSFLRGVPVRALRPPVGTQNPKRRLPGRRVKAPLIQKLFIKQITFWFIELKSSFDFVQPKTTFLRNKCVRKY